MPPTIDVAALLAALRAAGTDTARVEAKRARDAVPKRLWETISAFANTSGGGVILLGVDEASGFAVTGVANPKLAQDAVAAMCAAMVPPVRPAITIDAVEGEQVVAVTVPECRREDRPCWYGPSGSMHNGAFVRTGDGDHHLSPYEVHVLVMGRGQPTEDERPVAGATRAELDPAAVAAFLARLRDRRPRFAAREDDEILRTLRVLVRDGDVERPSVAGLLVLGREPQDHLRECAVVATALPGRHLGELGPLGERVLDDRRLEGAIGQMVRDAVAFVARNLRRPTIQEGATRRIVEELPGEAIAEAVANALAHRDYSADALGTPVQLRLFTDRLEIVSPGGLHGPVSADRLGEEGITSARNRTLLQLLEDAVLPGTDRVVAEHRGTGIALMKQLLARHGLPAPVFHDRIGSFGVTLTRPVHAAASTGAASPAPAAAAPETLEAQLLRLLATGGEWTRKALMAETGASQPTLSRTLAELVSRGDVVPTEANPRSPRQRYRLRGG